VIVRMGLLKNRADIDNHEFRQRWRDGHGPLAAKLPGRGGLDFDGFSELWFDDMPSMQAAFAAEKQIKELGEDEARFIGELKLITAVQHVVIPKPPGVRLIKRMSTLKRRADVSAEKFQEEWFDVHSVLVKRLPQVKAYTQNLIFDRSHGRGKPAKYEELPIDGVVELWFEDVDSLNTGFASDAGKTLMTHATEFISEISTFLVETHEVV
jgi:uncharacterized protein (TIGR02118 family)